MARKAWCLFLYTLTTVCWLRSADGTCSWPPEFANSVWKDERGSLSFSTSGMSGWTLSYTAVTVQTVSNWSCYDSSFYTTQGLLVMKATSELAFSQDRYIGYLCLHLTKLTEVSYRYYIYSTIQNNLKGRARATMVKITDTVNDTLTQICYSNTPDARASAPESGVWIKTGITSSAAVLCPYSLLANYTFKYTHDDGSVTCNSADVGTINMCDVKTQMKANMTACAPYPLYSGTSISRCVDVVVSGADTYVTLHNDVTSVDETFTYSCVAISSDGKTMSVTPNYCKRNQTSSTVPKRNDDTVAGSVVALTIIDGSPCPPCPTLNNISHGSYVITTSGSVIKATFTCEPGHSLTGNDSRVCQVNGSWTGANPSCFCSTPDNPFGGNVTISGDGLTATYMCHAGYIISGSKTQTCDTSSNLWSKTPPVCVPCENLGAPSNGNVTITSDGVTSYALFTCGDGYLIQGDSTSTCLSTGKWTNGVPVCYCSIPTTPSHGAMVVTQDHTMANYTCNTDYTLKGAHTRFCQGQGKGWSESNPECVQCSTIVPPSDGTLSSAISNGTATIATFQCNINTTISGDATAVCLDTGSWSPPTPTCVRCADPPDLGTGKYSFTSDGKSTSLAVTCDVGSTVSGSVSAKCDVTGNWIFATANSSTSCASCGAPPDPVGGSYTFTSNGTSTFGELTCDTGYVIQGGSAPVLECLSNGTWSQSSSSAECVSVTAPVEASDSNRLLPAVIALAVFCGVLAVAVVALVVKVVKGGTDKSGSKSGHAHWKGVWASLAPLDHTQHVMDNRVVPPLFKTKTDLESLRSTNDSTTPHSTSRMTSVVSSGNLQLHLIKEATSSSIYHDQPSPWHNVSFRGGEGAPTYGHSNHSGLEPEHEKESKKHKKRSSKKKLHSGTTSYDLGQTTPRNSRASPSGQRTPRTVPVQSREHSSLEKYVRSTTPVLQHQIGTSAEHELNTTPRAGLIPSVH